MSPACGGARLDTTPEHQTNGVRRPRRTTRAAQSRSVVFVCLWYVLRFSVCTCVCVRVHV